MMTTLAPVIDSQAVQLSRLVPQYSVFVVVAAAVAGSPAEHRAPTYPRSVRSRH